MNETTGAERSSMELARAKRPREARLVVPPVIALPYRVVGQGACTATVVIANDGDAPLHGVSWTLSGDASMALRAAPASLAAGARSELVLEVAAAQAESITTACLSVTSNQGVTEIPVFAVAGDPGLGEATWEDVHGAGGVVVGIGTTVAMPAAPYPDGASAFRDPSVRIFVPEGYRDRGAHDLVVHFHGWSCTLEATLSTHLYQQHLYASGSNAVLVVPQGPVNAPSGDFGKLMKPGGLTRLLTEVLVVLYREGRIIHPVHGVRVLTAHSGGYRAVAANLDPSSLAPPVRLVSLFDALYGQCSTYEAWTLAGGALRSNYTMGGGTLELNRQVAMRLAQQGCQVANLAMQRALRDAPAVIDQAATSHEEVTRLGGAYGERLRWRLPHSRRGPRIEMRSATAMGNRATVRWLSPLDDDIQGFVVEQSDDGTYWGVAAEVAASDEQASFSIGAGVRVRVWAKVKGLADAEVLRSNAYRLDPQPVTLVVDGIDRVLDGAFGGLRHDIVAMVGEAAGPVASVSHRAILEDAFALKPYPVVIWLLGDASAADLALSPWEQHVLRSYVDGGGRLVVSGSALAQALCQTAEGKAFLDHCFGAKGSTEHMGGSARHRVRGTGELSTVAGFTVGGPGALYPVPALGVLEATMAGQVLLAYATGDAAAVGIGGKAVLVGFPLELIDPAADRAALVKALLSLLGVVPGGLLDC